MNDSEKKLWGVFCSTIEKYGMDKLMHDCGAVVVAFSGGADSVCMLYLLHKYCTEQGIRLVAAHVNHMIRGDDADSDERFCRELAEKYSITIEVRRADVPALSKEYGRGLEEAARIVRYAFFDELAEKYGAVIATAHNASDNLETVVFNMLRGCTTHGICGILPIRDGRFIRPLIEVDGAEIRSFCDESGIGYVYDKTNSDTEYTRNYIRHVIAPSFAKLTPEPSKSVAKLSRAARRDDEFLDMTAKSTLAGRNFMPKAELVSLHVAISSRVLVMLYNTSKTSDSTIEERHINEILSHLDRNGGELTVSVPGGMCCVIERERVFFKNEKEPKNEDKNVFLYPRDGNVYENHLYKVIISPKDHNSHVKLNDNDENIYKLSTLRSFAFDKIKGTLVIRNRLDGDSYTFGGMKRRVKKLFIDKKMSLSEKSAIPIFCDDDGIIWIPGFPVRDGMAADKNEGTLVIDVYKKYE